MLSPQEEALNYLNKHNIPKLFDFLGAKLAYLQPDDLNKFLVSELQKIHDLKSQGKKYTIYDEENIASLFLAFDLTHRGYLTPQQYEKALLVLGIKSQFFPTPNFPTIDKSSFIKFVMKELEKDSF